MSANDGSIHPRAFRLYYGVVVAAAAAALLLALPSAGPPPLLPLTVVLALMVLSEAGPVPLPSGGYATASAVLDLASLVILGPLWTAGVDLASTLLVQGILLRKPMVRVVHNLAIFALTSLAAGYAFLAVGGRVGEL